MKTVLYYFTGTGNTLAAARMVADGLGDAQLLPITGEIRRNNLVLQGEITGIFFPVYMWGMPLMVRDFVQRSEAGKPSYIFGVATCGGSPGGALRQLDGVLRKKGRMLAAGFACLMPGNYTPLYGAPKHEKQQRLFSGTQEKCAEIVRTVHAREHHAIEAGNPFINTVFSKLLYPVMSKRIPGMDRKFYSEETCKSCGVCKDVCPADNITITGGSPVWHGRCEQCMACLQWCPSEAIQYGKRTKGRRRYRHPDVTAQDIADQKL